VCTQDIKSANVLLKNGDAKLADVGLSQMLRESFAISCSQGFGTFQWAATEVLTGSHPVRLDRVTLSIVLLKVATKVPAHQAHKMITFLLCCVVKVCDAVPVLAVHRLSPKVRGLQGLPEYHPCVLLSRAFLLLGQSWWHDMFNL
jgi:serine/threonine protein kinase